MSKFDIEKFPKSKTAKRMLQRVSPIYDRSYVGKWLYEVMGREWDDLWDYIKTMPDQVFTSTVTWGIEYQEDKYSLDHDASLTLEERRLRLYRKRSDHAPLSPWYIENYIKQAWDIELDVDETYANGVILLTIPFVRKSDEENLTPMYQEFRRIKPSHLSTVVLHQINGTGSFYYGGVVTAFKQISIVQQQEVPHLVLNNSFCTGGVVQAARRISIMIN